MKLSFEEFTKEVVTLAEKTVAEYGDNYAVEAIDVENSSKKYTGVSIRNTEVGFGFTLNVDFLYERYTNDVYSEKDTVKVIKEHIKNIDDDSTINEVKRLMSSWEEAQKYVTRRFCAINSPVLENPEIPKREFLDLTCFYTVVLPDTIEKDLNGSITITNDILKHWEHEGVKVTETDLFNAAIAHESYEIKSMFEALCELHALTEEISEDVTGPKMYVISNKDKQFGAVAMTSHLVLEQVAERMGSDEFYMLPSSIHECLAVSADQANVDELRTMVHQVNESEVEPEERLSESVYHYVNGALYIAGKEPGATEDVAAAADVSTSENALLF